VTNGCPNRKDQLFEAALGAETQAEFAEHLLTCPRCAGALTALRVRREQLDLLLPQIASGAEPPADFRARVLSAVETREPSRRFRWRLALAGAVAVATLVLALVLRDAWVRRRDDVRLVPVERIAQWRAPSDVFLETPGRRNLQTGPRLADSIVNLPVTQKQED
jgi:anti-sigma factor RsiW